MYLVPFLGFVPAIRSKDGPACAGYREGKGSPCQRKSGTGTAHLPARNTGGKRQLDGVKRLEVSDRSNLFISLFRVRLNSAWLLYSFNRTVGVRGLHENFLSTSFCTSWGWPVCFLGSSSFSLRMSIIPDKIALLKLRSIPSAFAIEHPNCLVLSRSSKW